MKTYMHCITQIPVPFYFSPGTDFLQSFLSFKNEVRNCVNPNWNYIEIQSDNWQAPLYMPMQLKYNSLFGNFDM